MGLRAPYCPNPVTNSPTSPPAPGQALLFAAFCTRFSSWSIIRLCTTRFCSSAEGLFSTFFVLRTHGLAHLSISRQHSYIPSLLFVQPRRPPSPQTTMILRLIPPNPSQPSITFQVGFKPILPDGVSIPQGWSTQLQRVLQDELETPECIHALDKAAWGVSLLRDVSFNASQRMITCFFVDGSRMDWPILDPRCLRTLHSVIQDVNTSFHASEQERERERGDRTRDVGFFPFSRPSTPVCSKPKTHKRSRSFLMTLVSCVYLFLFVFSVLCYTDRDRHPGLWFRLPAPLPPYTSTQTCPVPTSQRLSTFLIRTKRAI